MPITSVPIPPPAGSRYPKRKRREISYAETDFSDENLESSVIDADLACPLVKLINLNVSFNLPECSISNLAVEAQEISTIIFKAYLLSIHEAPARASRPDL